MLNEMFLTVRTGTLQESWLTVLGNSPGSNLHNCKKSYKFFNKFPHDDPISKLETLTGKKVFETLRKFSLENRLPFSSL